MGSKFIYSVATVFIFSIQIFAVSKGGYEIPSDEKTIESFGTAYQSELPRRFNLFNWNIEKAKQGEIWAADFTKLQNKYDLILIQEAVSDDLFMNALRKKTNTVWNYFIAWIRKTEKTSSGLIIGSEVRPTEASFTRTIDLEPYAKTPKLTGYQKFKIAGTENTELLIINIHAINFVTTTKFSRHIQQVMRQIDRHKGPVVFVGDMNTWNQSRLDYLFAEAKKRNLVWYDFERPKVKGMHSKLDHIFVRGLKVHEIKSLTDIVSSDHYPISADLEFL